MKEFRFSFKLKYVSFIESSVIYLDSDTNFLAILAALIQEDFQNNMIHFANRKI